MNIDQVTPVAGTSFIRIESLFNNIDTSGLVLPDIIRSRAVTVGRVIKSNMTGKDKAHIGVDSIEGCRVILSGRTGTMISEDVMVIHNLYALNPKKTRWETPILAIVPDNVAMAPVHDESKRCRFCGPARSENSQLSPVLVAGPGGVEACPRCCKTADGRIIDFQRVAT